MAHKTTIRLLSLFAAAFLIIVLPACVKDKVKETRTYSIMTPVYKDRAEIMAAINSIPDEAVEAAGKIYIKDKFIFLNEVNKGIHIIDNSNPSSPTQVAFLSIPGNLDIAVRGNILYADMYSDLLAIDITNPKKVTVTKTITNFFTNRMIVYGYSSQSTDSKVVVDWVKKDTTVEVDHNIAIDYCSNCSGGDVLWAAYASGGKSNGTAGSMAAMVLMNDYLYALREAHSVGVVNISNPSAPSHDTTFFAGFDLQTIYPFENKLFLGSMTGMFMYDVSNPLVPVQLGQFSHGRACDPVVTDGDYAYVTLHAGSPCGGDLNELNVVDIKDLMNPLLIKTYNLTKPTGLCKAGNLLFVCDDESGVRLYNATNPNSLAELAKINVKGSYDIIAGNNHAMVVAKDGLYQYDYSNVDDIRQLSFYALKK